MSMNHTISSAAMSGLFSGSYSTSGSAGRSITMADGDKHDCKGKNDCKGKGGCKSGDNGCKGKNSCKGKGGCKTK